MKNKKILKIFDLCLEDSFSENDKKESERWAKEAYDA
jgi:hypothetical protein